MRVGIQLPVQAQSVVFAEPWEASAGPDELLDVAITADRLGYDHLGVCDHMAIPADRTDKMGATWYDPIATLAWIAAETTRARLLTHVYILSQRHPLQAAKAFATLDRLSGGRLVIGVGAGHVEPEFAAVGVDFGRRGAITNESIVALRAALSAEVPVHHGEHFDFSGLAVSPRPIQEPPPIWIGGSSGPALRRAGALGDGWIPQGTPLGDMPSQIKVLQEARKAAGRDHLPFELGGMAMPMYVGEPGWDVGRWTDTGPPEKLAGIVRQFADLGVTDLQVRLRSRGVAELRDQLEAFATEVAPLAGAMT